MYGCICVFCCKQYCGKYEEKNSVKKFIVMKNLQTYLTAEQVLIKVKVKV